MTQVLKEHFPQCFDKNGDLMPQKLQEAILDLTQEINAQANTATQDLENEAAFSLSKESYSLNWLGKSYAKLLRHLPTHTLIAQDSAHNAQPQNANSKNVLIKGDNLEVLKHLKNAYYRKVKMIYIDPPYNTGNGDFIYNDERSFTPQSLAQMANIEIDEAKKILDYTLKNSSTHSAWLSFMYPRLYIARQLLRDDGVIFISIDDNEQANLKLLCDEIFGEENFVANIVWNSISSVLKQSKYIRKEHEYILCYANNKDYLIFNKMANTMEFSNLDNDPKGEWFSSNAAHPNQNSDVNKFAIRLPNGGECVRNWKFSYEDFISGKISLYFKDGNVPRLKIYKSAHNQNTKVLSSIFKDLGSITTAKTEMKHIFSDFDGDLFDTPKPLALIKQILQLITLPNDSDIILDFFAGSGTTAQAVMELNAEDKGNREFILVQLDEAIDKSKSKTAYEFCKNELGSENPTIFDITKERIKRASAKIATSSLRASKASVAIHETKIDCHDFDKSKSRNDREANSRNDGTNGIDLGFKIYELRENDFDSQNGALFKEIDKNALLESFRLQDSTPLSVENQTIDLGGYKAIRAGEKLYLLNSGFEMKHLQKLISLIDAQKDFVIKEISYLNDTFESARIREIEEGIKSYSNKKGLKILVRARFA